MKYLALLAAIAVIYFVIARQSPVASVKDAITETDAAPLTTGDRNATPAPTSLKTPFDRTHAALDKVKARNGDGEF